MAFSWDMLIAPGAALAGVGLTLFANAMRERTQFKRQTSNAQLQNKRASYSGFLCASDRMEQTGRQIISLLEQGAGHRRKATDREKSIIDQGADHIAELRRTQALLEIDGTPEIAQCARNLSQVHAKFEELTATAINGRQYDTNVARTILEEAESVRRAFVFACRQELSLSEVS